MLCYLSGPMTGRAGYNYPAFNAAAKFLRGKDFDIVNPAETAGGVTHLDREKYMRIDTGYVQACDAVIVLPGWHTSQGAKLEVALANALGKAVYTYDPTRGGIGRRVVVRNLNVFYITEDL